MVSPVPDVSFISRSVDDKFIVIATDGLWDIVSPETMLEFIKCRSGKSLLSICEEALFETSAPDNSSRHFPRSKTQFIDNITMFLVDCSSKALATS